MKWLIGVLFSLWVIAHFAVSPVITDEHFEIECGDRIGIGPVIKFYAAWGI